MNYKALEEIIKSLNLTDYEKIQLEMQNELIEVIRRSWNG